MCLQVEQGLLWIWPESGADAWLEASAKPPVTTPEMADPAYAGAKADFAFMENPASLQVMLVSGCTVSDVPDIMYCINFIAFSILIILTCSVAILRTTLCPDL